MERQPNFLIIMSDQHNPHIMGCAGDPFIRTPNLDRLAASGMKFGNAYCAAPVCVPSRMTFMTSKPCAEIDVWANGDMLDSREPTFAHALNEQGYQTVLCGRMHFRGPDQQHGFERRIFGDLYDATWAEVGYEPHVLGPTGGMCRAGTFGSVPNQLNAPQKGFFKQGKASVIASSAGKTALEAYDEHVVERAIAFLTNAEYDPDRPLAMVVGLFLPHNPYLCPKRLFDDYYNRVNVPHVDEEWLAALHPAARARWERYQGLSEEEHRRARAAYYGLTEVMDGMTGQILDALYKGPLGENAVVVYTSDHGDMTGEHGMWMKSSFLEASVRVPMIWSWPGHVPEGAVNNNTVSLLDVGTTLAAWAGRPAPWGSGRSMAPLLTGEGDEDWPDEACADSRANRMIRSGPFKLNYYHGYEEVELFDLEADPEENHDLRNDPAYRSVREGLLARLRRDADPEKALEAGARMPQRNEELYRVAEKYRVPDDLTWVLDQNDNYVE